MDRSLDFASFEAAPASRFRIISAKQLLDRAVFVLDYFIAGNEICSFKADFITREEAEIFLDRNFHEVIAVHIQFTAERNGSVPHFRHFSVVFQLHFFGLLFRIVGDDDLDRVFYHVAACQQKKADRSRIGSAGL